MELRQYIQELYDRSYNDIQPFSWMYENSRLGELVFCFIYAFSKHDPRLIRMAIVNLQNLKLLDIRKFETLDQPKSENSIIVSYILKEHGFSEQDSKIILSLLAHISKILNERYHGKIQRMLRKYGDEIRERMIED